MKLAAIIGLLGILFLPFLFLYQGWSVELYQHRKTVKQHLLVKTPIEQLVTLSFTTTIATTLDWEHEHEFRYEGEWYDIVHTDTVGDTIKYHCWWDHEETELYQKLESMLARHYGPTKPDTPQEKRCQQLLQQYILIPLSPIRVFASDSIISWHDFVKALPDTAITPLLPPPKA